MQDILGRLRVSGYVYHPRKRLSVLLCLFIVSPDLMEAHIEGLLSVLRVHDILLWTERQFALPWMKLLSHYVQYAYKQTDRLATDTRLKQTVIRVIDTLERICEQSRTDAGLVDRRLNHALLLRLCSQMHVRQPGVMLDRAISRLLADPPHALHSGSLRCDDADHIANLLENGAGQDETDETLPVGRFYTDRIELCVDAHNIVVREMGVDPTKDKPLFPETNLLSRRINVYIEGKLDKQLRGMKGDDLSYYRSLWRYAEKALTTARQPRRPVQHRTGLEVGDQTEIIVCRHMEGFLFECRIVQEGREGVGTLNVVGDVVSYYPTGISIASFCHNGQPLILDAYVKAVSPEDGTYEFAMIDYIQEAVAEWYDDWDTADKRLCCIMNNRSGIIERVPSISEEGFSVSVAPSDDCDINELHKNMVVEVGDIEKGPNGYLNATFIRELPGRYINRAEAFHRLMLWYAEKRVWTGNDTPAGDPTGPTDQTTIGRSVLEPRYVEELLAVIDSTATIETDSKKAYHYLSFCRLVSVLLGVEGRKAYFDSRLKLLELLDDFAVNEKVDEAKVRELSQRYEEAVKCNPILRHDVERLQIISCLNSNEASDADRLFRWSGAQSEPELRQLASLVLSYNYVRQAGLLPQSEEIRGRIYDLLRLRRKESTKKHYGYEDYNTEFKTSAVYPPNAMVVNISEQMHNILRVVCGFLNADGGTLYIGVNDQGYETGIVEDLKIDKFRNNPSTYQVFIEQSIVESMGKEASSLTRTHFEGEDDKVLVIEVDRCSTPIMLDGQYYERMGTATRKVDDNYLQTFLDKRRARLNECPQVTGTNAVVTDDRSATPQESASQPVTPPPAAPQDIARIATASHRNNVLHDYEPDYEGVTAVVCLMDNGEYKVLDDADYDEYPLQLAIHDNESDGWLVIVYANGNALKVPVETLLERERKRAYRRYADHPALFASIATKQDTLATCLADEKGKQYVRFDDIDNITEGTMQDGGKQLTDLSVDGIQQCDVIPTSSIPSDLPHNVPRKQRGIQTASEKGRRMKGMLHNGK